MTTTIRMATRSDGVDIVRIYNHYIADTCITFETEPVGPSEMGRRIAETINLPLPWLVAEEDGVLVGYAYASRWKGRCAYRFAVEATIYIDAKHTGKGLGPLLYADLIDAIKSQGMRSIIAGISLPNEGSVRLHERFGFEKVGHFERVGYKHDRWVDVGYWQLQC